MTAVEKIRQGKTCLGIEFGSTRIKAVLVDDTCTPLASGSYDWENRFENGYWTYSLEDIHTGLQSCYASLREDVSRQYGETLTTVGAMGISAMMHGYLAFSEQDTLLVPFRTWRNTTTEQAASELSELLHFNIPQRWSIAHLYQAILNREPHIPQLAHVTTLAGYIHYRLTGRREVGIGEASGIFPVKEGDYDKDLLSRTQKACEQKGFTKDLKEVLPKVVLAGNKGAVLTQQGAAFLDPTGNLKAGVALCPPEGDAGTGMVATNSVLPRTGNVSAGTSIFAMLVLEHPLNGVYPEIDLVTTPDGAPVAMVHCNNCCSELDAWVRLFDEFAQLSGLAMDKSKLYETLYRNALKGDADCGGVVAFNYLSGEPVTGLESGRPMYFRRADGRFNLANFFRAELYSAMASLKLGMDILFEKEQVAADKFTGHGGLFKIEGVAQQFLADGLCTPVAVMKTAGEGGAWGMAVLAAYMLWGGEASLPDYLETKVFASMESRTLAPESEGSAGFAAFMENYRAGLPAEKLLSV